MARILHIGKFFPPFAGGIENFLADLMPAQLEQGDIVAALVHDHQPRFSRFFTSAHLEVGNSLLIYRAPSYGRLLFAPVSPQFPFWLYQVIKDFKPTVLHLHMPNTSAFFALFLPCARRIPWVIHWHADVISAVHTQLSLAYHAYRPFEQRLLAHAQAIIVTSPPYLTSSIPLQNWQNKCHIVPLGLDKARLPEPTQAMQLWAEQVWKSLQISPLPELVEVTPKTVRLLSIGRLTYYKGYEILIQAMAQLHGAQLLIIGKGEEQPQLEKLIVKLKLTDKVKLLGYCTDAELTALLASCDCFCLPSLERTEAFGVVLLEAMRYAKPIVASAIAGSGVTWVVNDTQTGLLVPPHQPTPLANGLQTLINNPSLRQQMGETGYQRFAQFFDIRQVAINLVAIYRLFI